MSVEFLLWVLSIIFCSLSENIAVLCSGSCNQGFVALFLNSIILKCFISFSQNAFLRLNIITIAISEVGNFYSYCFFQGQPVWSRQLPQASSQQGCPLLSVHSTPQLLFLFFSQKWKRKRVRVKEEV